MKMQPVKNDTDWDLFAATAVRYGIKAQETQPETISEGSLSSEIRKRILRRPLST
jgi:hypothetical protein